MCGGGGGGGAGGGGGGEGEGGVQYLSLHQIGTKSIM